MALRYMHFLVVLVLVSSTYFNYGPLEVHSATTPPTPLELNSNINPSISKQQQQQQDVTNNGTLLDQQKTTLLVREDEQQLQAKAAVLLPPVEVDEVGEKKANLSALINETLIINKKTPSTANNNSNKQHEHEQWTFDRVEYDLMEFLQDLSARYKNCNESSSPPAATESLLVQDSPLEAKNIQTGPLNHQESKPVSLEKQVVIGEENSSSSTSSVASMTTTTTTTDGAIKTLPVVSMVKQETSTGSTNVTEKPSEQKEDSKPHPTIPPQTTKMPHQLTMTSLANLNGADSEIAESSWQYGIFDRFTRPKPSSTSTTREPQYMDSNGKMDTRSFNSDECGLREYDDTPQLIAHFPGGNDIFDLAGAAEASKELNQRRQRPPSSILLAAVMGDKKKQYLEPVGPATNTAGGGSSSSSSTADFERDAYESYKEHAAAGGSSIEEELAAEAAAEEASSGAGAENSSKKSSSQDQQQNNSNDSNFNLASRRHWLQQQLERTLELLGFNASSQSAAEFLNQTSGALSLNTRENMMKKSGKFGKSVSQVAAPGGGNSVLPNVLPSVLPALETVKSVAEATISSAASKLLAARNQVLQQQQQQADDMKLEARVIGGSDARLGDSPWSVSLQALVSKPGTVGVEYRHYCGGTIISEYYVLTAAHCLDFMVGRESRLFVVVGDLNWRMSQASLYGRRFGIEKLIIHSGYKSTAFGHDIGLIKTKESMRPLKVNGKYIINSVCLPEKGVEHSGEAELVGWGLFSNRNEMADTLQVADVPILPRPLCVDLYKRRTGLIQWLIGIELITEKQVCAGTFGRGICQGDSGSALVVNERFTRRHSYFGQNNQQKNKLVSQAAKANRRLRSGEQTRATHIGIVAFGGIRRCSYQSLPGVYMQTSKYMDWILPRIQS